MRVLSQIVAALLAAVSGLMVVPPDAGNLDVASRSIPPLENNSASARPSGYGFARGINLSAAAFNPERLPGTHGRDYIYPSSTYLDYYRKRGFDVVRLPFLWERLQHTLFGELDPSELDRIMTVVSAARARSMKLILSPHNYGRYRLDGEAVLVGTARVPTQAFADFWRRVAMKFKGETAIYAFSLMNEPHDSQRLWKPAAQAGLDAIRAVDATRLVLAPGDAWSEAATWLDQNGDFVLHDPARKIVYEAHQYFDVDHTGTYKSSYRSSNADSGLGIERVRPFAYWLQQHKLAGIVTEFGVPNTDPVWLELVDRLLTWLGEQRIPWVYWAGGPWWGDYPLSVEPRNGIDAAVMSLLTRTRAAPARQ